jgi:hypothetical protein
MIDDDEYTGIEDSPRPNNNDHHDLEDTISQPAWIRYMPRLAYSNVKDLSQTALSCSHIVSMDKDSAERSKESTGKLDETQTQATGKLTAIKPSSNKFGPTSLRARGLPPSKSLTIYAVISLYSPLYSGTILERPRLNAVKWVLYSV